MAQRPDDEQDPLLSQTGQYTRAPKVSHEVLTKQEREELLKERAVKQQAAQRLNQPCAGGPMGRGQYTRAPKVSHEVLTKQEREELLKERAVKQQAAQRLNQPCAGGPMGRWWRKLQSGPDKVTLAMSIVALGVVYGDIGTSPLYTMQTFLAGQGGVTHADETAVIGMLSLVFWTMTLITTIEYVVICMRVDNKGEGGIFALYTLLRRYGGWLIVPAMIGGAAFLADSVLTPAMSISSAVEGLQTLPALQGVFASNPNLMLIITLVIILGVFAVQSRGTERIGKSAVEGLQTLPALQGVFASNPNLMLIITLVIILGVFAVQSRGTERIGKVFGTAVLIWFLFIAVTGAMSMAHNLEVLRALNPVYGMQFLLSGDNHAGLALMGTVFLSITGAEALYSDMGHVGRGNIYAPHGRSSTLRSCSHTSARARGSSARSRIRRSYPTGTPPTRSSPC